MKKIGLTERVINLLTGYNYYKLEEMSLIGKRYTNLPENFWVDDVGKNRHTKHNGFRIKIQNNQAETAQEDQFELYYDDGQYKVDKHTKQKISDRDKNEIIAYIEKYKKIFEDHWNQEIDANTLYNRLREQGAYKDEIYKKLYVKHKFKRKHGKNKDNRE